MPFFIVGTAFTSPIAVPTQVTCNNAACTLACNPLVVVTGAALNLRIPNDPTLVGFDLCVQCVDVQPSQNCVTLSQALSIMILP